MASKMVSFRATPPLDEALAERGEKWGSAAQTALERYLGVLAAELATVCLSEGEALLICDVLNGTCTDEPLWRQRPAQLLAMEIEDAEREVAEHLDVDTTALAAAVAGWRTGQAIAVIDAVERWWRLTDRDNATALATVGLAPHGDAAASTVGVKFLPPRSV